jgi:hypothetical protein
LSPDGALPENFPSRPPYQVAEQQICHRQISPIRLFKFHVLIGIYPQEFFDEPTGNGGPSVFFILNGVGNPPMKEPERARRCKIVLGCVKISAAV